MTSDKPKQVDLHGDVVINKNTLAYQFPEIAAEWDYQKNELTPEDYKPHAAAITLYIYLRNTRKNLII